MGIPENIKQRRMELGLSQQELADILGYKTRSTINKIELGDNKVPENKLVKYAKALDTTVEFLRTGVKRPKEYIVPERVGKRTIAIILAGGKSTRNQQNIPNQFINVLGKPIIIYSLEAYQRHPAVDDIYIVCLKGWEGIVDAYAKQYEINKLRGIIPAGETGVLSVKNGIEAINCDEGDTLILQESTRPLITEEIISKLLLACRTSAVVCEPMDDYVQFYDSGIGKKYLERERLLSLQSPDAYKYATIKEIFERAEKMKHKLEETCFPLLMYNLGYELNFVEGNHNNVKVVRQEDIAILTALLKNRL